MSQYKNQMTDHHIIAKENNWSNDPNNIKRLRWKTHEAIHTVFGNKMPHEQIEMLLLNYNKTALNKEFINDIMQILLESDLKYYYKDWIFLPR